MRAIGKEGKKPTRLPTTCRHLKVIVGRYRVDSSPFAVGKVRTSLSQLSVAASPREKTKTAIFRVRAGGIFANRFGYGLKLYPADSIGELGAGWCRQPTLEGHMRPWAVGVGSASLSECPCCTLFSLGARGGIASLGRPRGTMGCKRRY
jgi:hypothetical protein